jgi:hypothetical protein
MPPLHVNQEVPSNFHVYGRRHLKTRLEEIDDTLLHNVEPVEGPSLSPKSEQVEKFSYKIHKYEV